MNLTTTFVSFALGLLVIPAAFFGFCIWMTRSRAHWLCYPAYFFQFGIVGGMCVAGGLWPSGLAVLCMLVLVTAAPLACFCSSVALNSRHARGRFANVAMILGYCYSGLIFIAF